MSSPIVVLVLALVPATNAFICSAVTAVSTPKLVSADASNPLFVFFMRLFSRYWALSLSLSSLILSLLIEAVLLYLSESFR